MRRVCKVDPGGRRRERRSRSRRVELAALLQLLLEVVNAVSLLVGRTHLVLVHGGDPVVLAVEAVEVEGNAANLVLSFVHVLVVGGLDSDDVLAVSFLKV